MKKTFYLFCLFYLLLIGFFVNILITYNMTNEKLDAEVVNKIVYEGYDIKSCSYDDISTNILGQSDNVNLWINLKSDFNSGPYKNNIDATYDEAQTVKRNLRRKGQEYHYTRNLLLAKELGIDELDNCYISKYSPFIELKVSNDVYLLDNFSLVKNIARNKVVSTIYVQTNDAIKAEPILIDALNKTAIYDWMIYDELDGSGINIGVLEPAIADIDNPNINGSNIVIRDEWYYFESEHPHTTAVCSIVGCNTGIARGANIYDVELAGTPTSEMDWLLDNHVDIINMSFATGDINGYYSSISAYMDYIVRIYGVVIIAGAGNEGERSGYVSNPAMGYNVIAVGASCSGMDEKTDFTSYITETDQSKPNIVAPGSAIELPTYDDYLYGTSYAAPIVTGAVALLMEEIPGTICNPELVNAMLHAGARNFSDYTSREPDGFNYYIGAGEIHLDSLMDVLTQYRDNIRNSSNSLYEIIYTKRVYLIYNYEVKSSIFSLAFATGTASETKYVAYKFELFKEGSSVPLKTSYLSTSNTAVIEYHVTETDYYYFKVTQMSNAPYLTSTYYSDVGFAMRTWRE